MAYGKYNEVEFCKKIANSEELSKMLFEAASMPIEYDSFELEKLTTPHHKRIDIAYMDGDEVSCIVEAQDASGQLDPLHASKVSWYSFSGQCSNVIILARIIDETLREYVKWENLHPHKNINIVQPIFDPKTDELICFNPYYVTEGLSISAQSEKRKVKTRADENALVIGNYLSDKLDDNYVVNKGYAYYKSPISGTGNGSDMNIQMNFQKAEQFTLEIPPLLWKEKLSLDENEAVKILSGIFGYELKRKENGNIGGGIKHEEDILIQAENILTKIPEVFALHK